MESGGNAMSVATSTTVPERAIPEGRYAPGRPGASPLDRPHRITVDDYQKMIEAGVFDDARRVFLWKGLLVTKMTKGQPHNIALGELDERMGAVVPPGWHVRQEMPVILSDDSAPEPDLSIARGARRDFPRVPPGAADVPLIVEVADSSLAEDRGEMAEGYADASIPIYCVVNLPGRCVEVYSEPTGPCESPTYRVGRRYGPGEEVPVVLDGREVGRIAVAGILP